MASEAVKIQKLKDKEAQRERIERVAKAVGTALLDLLKNPMFAGLAALAGVTAVGRVKNDKGEYVMSSATLRTLRGLSMALPVYQASGGGTAGILAGSSVAGVLAASTARPADRTAENRDRERFYIDPNAPSDLTWAQLQEGLWTAHRE